MTTPHKHAELIKKWADGAQIQVLDKRLNEWVDCSFNQVTWGSHNDYRIKPEITTSLSTRELWMIYFKATGFTPPLEALPKSEAVRRVADAAIKQYIKEQTK